MRPAGAEEADRDITRDAKAFTGAIRNRKGAVLYFEHFLVQRRDMARKLRVEYGGAIYHVMNRGDRRELVFLDDEDRQRFVTSLGEADAPPDCHSPRPRPFIRKFTPSDFRPVRPLRLSGGADARHKIQFPPNGLTSRLNHLLAKAGFTVEKQAIATRIATTKLPGEEK